MSDAEPRPTSSTAVARGLLIVGGLIMLGTGLLFLVRPTTLTDGMGVEMPTAVARTDVRATYGGILGGIGVFLGLSSVRKTWLVPGLVLAACVGLGAVVGRVYGFGIEGTVDVRNVVFGALELVLGAAAAVLAWRVRSARFLRLASLAQDDVDLGRG